MAPSPRMWLGLAAAGGFIAVAAGAFGAHALQGTAGERELAVFETGARYGMYHALALLAVAWLADKQPDLRSVRVAGWAFVVGIILFCVPLYHIGLTGSRALAIVAPLGGTAFLIGWGALLVAAFRWTTSTRS